MSLSSPLLQKRFRPVFAIIIAVCLMSCEDTAEKEGIVSTLQLDTRPCLGVNSACRRNVTNATNQGAGYGNACLVIVSNQQQTTERRRLAWIQNRLSLVDQASLSFQAGDRIQTSLFILESGDDPLACMNLNLEALCEPTVCLVKLGPVETIVPTNGLLSIDFRQAGACKTRVSTPPHPALTELCNDLDDDCDGRADETFGELGQPCQENSTCAAAQVFACASDQQSYSCVPASTEICDGVDNDCNGLVDDIAGCESSQCNTSADCLDPASPICADGQCRACLDGTAECGQDFCDRGRCVPCITGTNRGCSEPNARICRELADGRSTFCDGCQSSADCGSNNQLPPICDRLTGQCVDCQQNSPLWGCDGDEQGLICDPNAQGGSPCRSCNPGDCIGNQRCIAVADGTRRCEGCDPTTNQPCDADGQTPICRARADGGFACQTCNGDDAYCANVSEQLARSNPASPSRPYCSESGRCIQCRGEQNQYGCNPTGDTPLCSNGFCSSCVTDQDCDGIPNADAFCVAAGDMAANALTGQCVECELNNHNGCGEGSPICDQQTRRCRACEAGDICSPDPQTGRPRFCVGDACLGCNPDGDAGCSNAIGEPICDANSGCRACLIDIECEGVANNDGRDLCYQGRCVRCRPDRPGSCAVGQVCAPSPNTGELQCGGCTGNADCAPDGFCVDGACQPCDPSTNDGCGGVRPECHPQTFECVQCLSYADCRNSGFYDACIDNNCQACGNGSADDPGCRGFRVGEDDLACVQQKCRTCRFGAGESPFCPEATPYCHRLGSHCLGVCNVAANTRDRLPISPGCDAANPQCHYVDIESQLVSECRLCYDSTDQPGVVDLGCSANFPRCLGRGARCCSDENDMDCQ